MELHLLEFTPDEIAPFRKGLEDFIDSEKRSRIRRFLFQPDYDRALLGDIFARTLLCRTLGLENKALSFGCNTHGKPHLDLAVGIQYNISHSGNWIACGIGPGRIGVDVEKGNPANLEIAGQFFAPREVLLLNSASEYDKERLFHEIWTLKESFIKARGLGLSIPLAEFEMVFAREGIRAFSAGHDTGFHFRLYTGLDPGYAFAACGDHPPPHAASRWTCESLVRAFVQCSSYRPEFK